MVDDLFALHEIDGIRNLSLLGDDKVVELIECLLLCGALHDEILQWAIVLVDVCDGAVIAWS